MLPWRWAPHSSPLPLKGSKQHASIHPSSICPSGLSLQESREVQGFAVDLPSSLFVMAKKKEEEVVEHRVLLVDINSQAMFQVMPALCGVMDIPASVPASELSGAPKMSYSARKWPRASSLGPLPSFGVTTSFSCRMRTAATSWVTKWLASPWWIRWWPTSPSQWSSLSSTTGCR